MEFVHEFQVLELGIYPVIKQFQTALIKSVTYSAVLLQGLKGKIKLNFFLLSLKYLNFF